MSLQVLFTAGILAIKTVGTPGIQGAGVAGTQGIGVRTPRAAAVAAATVGLAGELHKPKGKTFTIGLLSMILAAGFPPAMTRLAGRTTKDEGVAPNEQVIIAPIQTCCPIIIAIKGD